MASTHSSGTIPISDWKWSHTEKTVARDAFDLALSRALEDIIRKARERAARVTEASALWELERWIGERHRQIDNTFDYRYSVLPLVFASLLRDRRISEDDLLGLAPDKIDVIRHMSRS
jgi:hypothetical protein